MQTNKYTGIMVEENTDLEILCREGLKPVYRRIEATKYKLAHECCMAILGKIENWENHWRNASNCFSRSSFYGQHIMESNLSDTDRIVFFYKILADNISKNSKKFYSVFPEECHCFNKDNFERLCDWLNSQRWSIKSIDSSQETDDESVIMSALRNGEGDSYGF